jgi:hypothetical protein
MLIKRYELVELQIGAGSTGSKFEYPDIPDLRDDTEQDIIICGLETWSIDAMPLSPSGIPVATMDQLQNSFLTLYVDQEQSINEVPLVRLLSTQQSLTSGPMQWVGYPFELANLKVNWNKSFIQAAESYSTGGANAEFSIMLGVWYKKLPPGKWSELTAGQVKGM